jgi:hypothetical protein
VLALVEEDLEMDLEWVGVLAKAESLQIGLTRLALEYANDVGCGDAVRLRLEITAEASRDPKIATVFTDVETRLVTAVSHLLADRQAKGEIDLALDPEVAARTVLAFLDGLFGWIAVGGASQENEAFVRAALELMWRGLKPAAP